MMHRNNKLATLVSLLVVLATVLSACGGAAAPAAQTGEQAGGQATTAPAAGEAQAGGQAAAPAAGGEKVKVVWWNETYESALEEKFKTQFVDAFNAAHPNIELEVVFQQDNDQVTRTAMQAGEGPDILQTPGPGYLLEYQKAGLLAPLDDYAAQFGWKERVLPWAYESSVVDGKLYGLPLTFESMVMIYNKAVLNELGLKPPTNRAEFEQVADAIKASGRKAIAYGNVGWQPTNEHLVGMWLNSYAGRDKVYEALTGKRRWDDPVFVEAIKLLTDYMTTKGYFSGSLQDYYSVDWNTEFGMLAEGKAGLMTVGSWGFRGAHDNFTNNPDDWDWAMMPSFSEGVPQGFDLAIGGTASINAKSANPDAAAEVLHWLYEDNKRITELASIFSFGEFVVPVQYAASDFPAETDPRITRFYEEFGKATAEGNYGYTSWTFWPAEAETQLWKDIELVWSGEMTAEEYLAKQQEAWDKARAANAVPPIPTR